MASAGDEDSDAVLSDVEGEVVVNNPSEEEFSIERFRELLSELNRERQAREAAENSTNELSEKFNRLKALAHESIKRRDESARQRDEALREKEEISRSNEKLSTELAEANKAKDETFKQLEAATKAKDGLITQLEEMTKAKDGLRTEMETSAHMLVTGIDKISGKVNSYKNFSSGGLPKSQKYTGLPAVAYGVIKRTNEIVEELTRQIDAATKSRNDVREQMDHRNYEIAIEVSQLEATISGLRDEVAKKSDVIENLEKSVSDKDVKIAEIEKQSLELKQLVGEYDDKLLQMEQKIESQRPLLVNQLNLVSKIHDRVYNVIKIVGDGSLDLSELSESMFVPQETDMEENIRASLAGMESICHLTGVVAEMTRGMVDEKSCQLKGLQETVDRLFKEKEHIGSLLRSALSKRMTVDPSSKTNELFQAAENGLREAGIDFKFSKLLEDGKVPAKGVGSEEDDIYTLAGALENIVKASQLEIIELRHSVEDLRAESRLLKEQVDAQTKELSRRMKQIEELEEKERVANESVEGLMLDVAAAEEEITRWKAAAEQEAAAGRAVEQEFTGQLSALKQELEEARQALLELENKLKFKEETAAAAMAARDAAEKSLRLADTRASRLRERVEELSHQLEEFETREDSRGRNGPRYVCWPWQWLGMDFVGFHKADERQQSSNEMELSEPLM